MDPRDRAPSHPARPVGIHARASFEEPDKVREEDLAASRLSRARLRHRDPFHAELPAVAAAHRLRAGRRPVSAVSRSGKGVGGDRRDRPFTPRRHPAGSQTVKSPISSLPPPGFHLTLVTSPSRLTASRRFCRTYLSRHERSPARAQHGLGVRLFSGELDPGSIDLGRRLTGCSNH